MIILLINIPVSNIVYFYFFLKKLINYLYLITMMFIGLVAVVD